MRKALLFLAVAIIIAAVITAYFFFRPNPSKASSYRLMGKELVLRVSNERASNLTPIIKAVLREMRRVERLVDTNDATSQLSAFNRGESGHYDFDTDNLALLRQAKKYCDETLGNFDITLGPVIEQWARASLIPSDEVLKKSRAASHWDHIRFTERGLEKLNQETQLNLAAVAKGYAMDRAVSLLQNNGIEQAYVEVGGNIRVFGTAAFTKPEVTFYDPVSNLPVAKFHLSNYAYCTSGNPENYIVLDNKVFSNIVNSITLRPPQHPVRAAVLASTATYADAWATALSANAPDFIASTPNDIAVLLAVRIDGKTEYYADKNMELILEVKPNDLKIVKRHR